MDSMGKVFDYDPNNFNIVYQIKNLVYGETLVDLLSRIKIVVENIAHEMQDKTIFKLPFAIYKVKPLTISSQVVEF